MIILRTVPIWNSPNNTESSMQWDSDAGDELDALSWTDAEMDKYFDRLLGISHRFYFKVLKLINNSKSTKFILNIQDQISKMK